MKVYVNVELDELLWLRWLDYHTEAPGWTFDDLVSQLLAQHFSEADTVRQSVEEQERRKGS